MANLNEILNQFVSDCKIAPYGDGHINDTYLTSSRQFILQKHAKSCDRFLMILLPMYVI